MTAMVLLSDWMASQVEFWKPITQVEGYDVSNFGRVRSWRTIRPVHGKGTVRARRKSPLILKPYADKYSYVIMRLDRTFNNAGGKGFQTSVHRLVAEAFVPNPDGKPHVNHLTGLKGDNRSDGLKWATRSENAQHAWATGLQKRDRFAVSKKMVLARKDYRDIPEALVRMIRTMLADGISQGQIRRWSGLKASTIQSIAVGRTYRDVA